MVQFGLLVRRGRGGHLARLRRRPTTVLLLRMLITVVMVMVGGGRRRVASCPRRASAHRGSFL